MEKLSLDHPKWAKEKLVCLNPAFSEGARINGNGGALLGPAFDSDAWPCYVIVPWSMACIIKALEEMKPEVLNRCLREMGAKTQF